MEELCSLLSKVNLNLDNEDVLYKDNIFMSLKRYALSFNLIQDNLIVCLSLYFQTNSFILKLTVKLSKLIFQLSNINVIHIFS